MKNKKRIKGKINQWLPFSNIFPFRSSGDGRIGMSPKGIYSISLKMLFI